jgi:photosystem II stability/assembly factor-like uncharacterized protein
MKLSFLYTVFFQILTIAVLHAQWQTFDNGPQLINGFRFDDVYFTSRDHGSVISQDGYIYTTFDGGVSWHQSEKFNVYLRAIEYISPEIGFAGSLDHLFLRTDDGGLTWTDISHLLPGDNTILCGLSHYGDAQIHGVGNYAGPALFFKSEDSGNSWTKMDLDSLLFAAIDVYFLTDKIGYICGSGPDTDSLLFEGRILKTIDGGNSWTLIYSTGEPYTYIWKMDFLENGWIFGSVETFRGERPAIVRSQDEGLTWSLVNLPKIDENYFDGQGIGFINNNLGWFAGYGIGMYTTDDGGLEWTKINETVNINRFFKIDSSYILASGMELYFLDLKTTSVSNVPFPDRSHLPHEILQLSPNPAKDFLSLSFRLDNTTSVLMDINQIEGKWSRNIQKSILTQGIHSMEIGISDLIPGKYVLSIRTHERHLNRIFIKH